ncbi:queuosine precursor transporter [Halorubrum sp. C191]|uniref:queuosine precursor transporter n=1 Tax=Halorubrum sp. C191 TaxID=1383842 RepID=UPI00130448D4|nr:queuosine precursor transporter [Halorubrum sp. C191]
MTIVALFVASLVTANITATKLAVYDFPILGEMTGSVGAFMIGVSFLMTDLLSEVYGKKTARRVVNATIIALAATFAMVSFAVWMPAAADYSLASEFAAVLSGSYSIVTASVLSLILSQNIDVSVFHAVRRVTGFRHKWARNMISTGTSQLVDTAVWTWLAFIILPPVFGGTTVPFAVTISIITTEYIIKMVFAAGDTAVFYAASGLAERAGLIDESSFAGVPSDD